MNQTELIKLNDEIKSLQLLHLDKLTALNDDKKSLKQNILVITNDLEKQYAETKDKSLSNSDKREAIANKQFGSVIAELEKRNYEIRVLEIEIDHKKRLFKLMIRGDN